MKKGKITVFMMTALMGVTLLTGCGKEEGTADATGGAGAAGTEVQETNGSITVTFYDSDGSTVLDTKDIETGTCVEEYIPEKDGYTFAGWFATPQMSHKFDFTTELAEDTSLFAAFDDTITSNCYSKLAERTYFATLTTPDVYSTFYDELVMAYEAEGMSSEDAKAAANENLIMTTVPALPESGDLTEDDPVLVPPKTMGGINGYAVSAYTKSTNACLAFIDFAAGYDMIMKRYEMLGIAPAREDAAQNAGGVSAELYSRLENGETVLMPSIKGQ